MGTTDQVRRSAESSEALDRGIRVGLVAYGVTHVVVAATALPLAWGERTEGQASQKGAFARMAEQPLGNALLGVIAAGLACLTIWQLAEAVAGHRGHEGGKRVAKRLGSAVKSVVYAVLAWSAVTTAWGQSGSGGSRSTSPDGISARLMSAPGGTLVVAAVGLAVIGVGGYLVHKGWSEGFTRGLDARATQGEGRAPIVLLGKIGHISKGVSLGTVGALFLTAAVQHQPKESGGLDVALRELLRQPFGPVLLAVVSVGIGCFGVYCFFWARYLRR